MLQENRVAFLTYSTLIVRNVFTVRSFHMNLQSACSIIGALRTISCDVENVTRLKSISWVILLHWFWEKCWHSRFSVLIKKQRKEKISIIRSSLKSPITLSQRISVEVNIVIKVTSGHRWGQSEKEEMARWDYGKKERRKSERLSRIRPRRLPNCFVNIQFSCRRFCYLSSQRGTGQREDLAEVTKRQYCGALSLASRHVHLL